MGSLALLDYALFQLTPTRTRCDLVLVSGGKSEKIASGLVETFVSHLKFVKDQVSKGGYSITLHPPNSNALWFTKSTFQRFVRFVSTPEILERFVHIEREILQIENSIQSNESSNTNISGQPGKAGDGIHKKPTHSSQFASGVERDQDAAVEKTSKFHLQRLLYTRKALLQKEQAMAYARAIVAGFEVDFLDNLIHFSEVFGASRLQEACVQFKELYKRKHTDGQWMEELAAMRALSSQDLSYEGTPGIVLAHENSLNNDMSTDATASPPNSNGTADNKLTGSAQIPLTPPKGQLQMPWPNQIPQYMYSQSPNHQLPPYQGYPFPPFFPGQMQWPHTMEHHARGNIKESNNHRHHKSSRKKDKTSSVEGTETSEDDEQTESSDSGSGADSDTLRKEMKHSSRDKPRGKKHKKKSSKTVVIRNINYITSKKGNASKNGMSDDCSSVETLEEDAIRREVDDATHHITTNICKGEGKNDNWNAFQTLLRSCEEPLSNGVLQQHPASFQDEQLVDQRYFNDISEDVRLSLNLESSKDKKLHSTTDDSLLSYNNIAGEGTVNSLDFANGENLRPNNKKINYQDAPLISKGFEESGGSSLETQSEFASEETVIRKSRQEEDWFIVNHSENVQTQEMEQSIFGDNKKLPFGGDSFAIETRNNVATVDDSFMVQSRSEVDDRCDSLWRTDISSVVEWKDAQHENADAIAADSRPGMSKINEPDDLCVVLVRDTGLETTETSWTPEMDYGMEMYVPDKNKRTNAVKTEDKVPENDKIVNNKRNGSPVAKKSVKDAGSRLSQGSLAKSKKTQPASRLMVQKSKLETEEEVRKRMEALVIERQKRIAERTAARGVTPVTSSKRLSGGGKPVVSKLDKQKPGSKVREAKI